MANIFGRVGANAFFEGLKESNKKVRTIQGKKPPMEVIKATIKGNSYQTRLAKLTAKDNSPKLVRRERLNNGSTFAFAFIGEIKDHYPKRVVRTVQTLKPTRSNNRIVSKSEAILTIAGNTEVTMHVHDQKVKGQIHTLKIKSGKLPAWFR